MTRSAVTLAVSRRGPNGGEAMPAPGDVTDEGAVQGYIGEVLRRWCRIDILVNNAALTTVA